MRHRSVHASRRLRLFAVAGALVAGGLVIAAAVPSGASSSPRVAPRQAAPPPLSHFLCYRVTAPAFKIPKGVQIGNAIQTAAPYALFTPGLGPVSWHCNPAAKEVLNATGAPPTVTKMVNPNGHLLCWGVDYQPVNKAVVVSNQFGTDQPMYVTTPLTLCVPSWKKRAGPPDKKVVEPPKLDHFTCYAANPQSTWSEPFGVKALDEFSAPNFEQLSFATSSAPFAPNELCFPTIKVVNGKTYPTQGPDDLGLACWAIGPTTQWKSWFDQNQFGQGKVKPALSTSGQPLPEEFCLPSTIAPLSPKAG